MVNTFRSCLLGCGFGVGSGAQDRKCWAARRATSSSFVPSAWLPASSHAFTLFCQCLLPPHPAKVPWPATGSVREFGPSPSPFHFNRWRRNRRLWDALKEGLTTPLTLFPHPFQRHVRLGCGRIQRKCIVPVQNQMFPMTPLPWLQPASFTPPFHPSYRRRAGIGPLRRSARGTALVNGIHNWLCHLQILVWFGQSRDSVSLKLSP